MKQNERAFRQKVYMIDDWEGKIKEIPPTQDWIHAPAVPVPGFPRAICSASILREATHRWTPPVWN